MFIVQVALAIYPSDVAQIHTPPWYQGGNETLPRVLDMLKYFETILPLVESHWSS